MAGVRFLTEVRIYPLTMTPRTAVKHKPTAYPMGIRGQSSVPDSSADLSFNHDAQNGCEAQTHGLPYGYQGTKFSDSKPDHSTPSSGKV